MIHSVLSGLQDLLFPRNCLLCHQYCDSHHPSGVCVQCRQQFALNIPPFCVVCSHPLKPTIPETHCPTCLKNPPSFDIAWGAYRYNQPMRKLIHHFKYHGKTGAQYLASELILNFCQYHHINLNQYDEIIPMPLHDSRQRERGFNQAALMASMLFPQYNVQLLFRVKNTPFQSHLAQKDRWTNVHGAFKMNPLLTVENKSILIIDDLLTTGATASEAAKTLKKAGASRVSVLTLAIT